MVEHDTTEWAEGFKAGYAAGYSDGYTAGRTEGVSAGRALNDCERKRLKYEEKARRHREKEARRAAFLAAGSTATPEASVSASADAARHDKTRKGRTAQAATSTATEQISPDMVRLRATAPGLVGRELTMTDHYVKILFPPADAPYEWPSDLGAIKDAYPKHLHPVTRTYTLRSCDTSTGDIVIDFVLHGDSGIAGPWARDAKVGDTFSFLGPGGGWAPTPEYDHFVLAGDESAAPAVAAALEKIPAGSTAVAFLEVEAPGHEVPIPESAAEVCWVYRHGTLPGRALSEAVRSYAAPAGYVGWFVHGVADMVKEVRRDLFVNRRVSKRDASISGYWRLKMTEDEWQSTKRDFVAQMESAETAEAAEASSRGSGPEHTS